MSFRSNTRRASALVLTLCLSLTAQTAFAAAGKVLFVAGSVSLERSGTRALKAGDPLDAGDVVVTGAQSRAQILMADGARIALRAGSRFRIDEFALPSNVQQPGMAVAVAASGKSVGTLLKGGFSTRDGAVAKSNPAGYEMRTPIGTLGIRGTYYTAVFCRGDCADAPGLPAGQPIADGLYLVVDEGTITFNGRGLSLTLAAPIVQFIPLETSDPQQLTDPPAFLRNDGAGRLEAAGRNVRIAASNAPLASDVNDRRGPTDAPNQQSSAPSDRILKPAASEAIEGDSTGQESSDTPPERSIVAKTSGGRTVDLIEPKLPSGPQTSVATAVLASTGQPAFTAATTQPSDASQLNATGSLVQFDAPYGTGTGAPLATYDSASAALLGTGSNGASAIRWGRWSTGTATATTSSGAQNLSLANASLHWIIGPSFELAPVLPVAGSTNFTLAGGTNPTDTGGRIGSLNAAVLSADFTAQQVSTTLSLDINGLNWLASGSGPITAGTVRFGGTFNTVLVDGRVSGAGNFNGFFSAGATTPDQLNGAGLGYQLTDSLNQLGTISGVAAFVPGAGQAPTAPTVSRDLAYAVGSIGDESLATGSGSNVPTQLSVDANGNLTSLSAPLARGAGAMFALGTATVANIGADAATGIRWGRWESGTVNMTIPPNPTETDDITGGALHWIAGTGYGAAPAIPQTGTASYVLVGNTNPTDTLGNVGALGAASFSADFTNRTVASALSLTMAGRNYFAGGAGTFAANSTLFSGTYDTIGIDNLLVGTGNFSGFFTVPRVGGGTVAGAGLAYNIVGIPSDLSVVSGALAFQQGSGTPVTPPPLQQRDIAVMIPAPGPGEALVATTATQFYAVDANFDLTKVLAYDTPSSMLPATFELDTATVVETNVDPVIMMRWGRWSGGDVTVTTVADGTVTTLDLSQASLHWIESADALTPPVMPVTGTVSYQLAGWTTPTDRAGNLGTLNSATFDADFTGQLVTSALDLTVNGITWVASGQGVIGAQLGLPAHQFSGSYNGTVSPVSGLVSGTFSGFFTNPGGATDGPAGAGLTYHLSAGQLGLDVDGAAVFRKAPPSP